MERLKPLALLLLRVALGIVFIYHGYPKLFTHTRQTMYALTHEDGLPAYFAYIAGAIEFGGGAMLLAGFFTTCAGLALTIEQAVILWKVDRIFAHPLAVDRYQLTAVCVAGAFMLAAIGAGPISLDAARGKGRGKSFYKPKRRD
jgi:putative oxidoreductase